MRGSLKLIRSESGELILIKVTKLFIYHTTEDNVLY